MRLLRPQWINCRLRPNPRFPIYTPRYQVFGLTRRWDSNVGKGGNQSDRPSDGESSGEEGSSPLLSSAAAKKWRIPKLKGWGLKLVEQGKYVKDGFGHTARDVSRGPKLTVDHLIQSVVKDIKSPYSLDSSGLGRAGARDLSQKQLGGTNTVSLPRLSPKKATDSLGSSGARQQVKLVGGQKNWEEREQEFYVAELSNVGNTMLPSDIKRSLGNHAANIPGWRPQGAEIEKIVPARTAQFQHLTHYYVYFYTAEGLEWHTKHFAPSTHPDSYTDFPMVTFPPPAASSSVPDSLARSIVPWQPTLVPVKFRKLPNYMMTPNILLESDGAPGRTVYFCLVAGLHWQYLQVWLKYDVIEAGGFGRALVNGGDSAGFGIQRVDLRERADTYKADLPGGGWLVRFRKGLESEAYRLVREWDGKWVNIRGNWGKVVAELQW